MTRAAKIFRSKKLEKAHSQGLPSGVLEIVLGPPHIDHSTPDSVLLVSLVVLEATFKAKLMAL